MSARAVTTLVAACVVGFGGFGILSADAANPAGFAPVVNPLSQLPAGGELNGTSCTSSSQCVAVGSDIGYQPLSLAGNPSTWGAAQVREITLGAKFDKYGDGSEFLSVSCTSPTSCVAVGADGSDQPLSLSGDPATWTPANAREITLDPFAGSYGVLWSVACTSSTACVAVGSTEHGRPLVLVGNPATWTATQAHEIPLSASLGSRGSLRSVACTSASSCVAVGSDGTGMPLVFSGDPSTWQAGQAREVKLGSTFGWQGLLRSVACTSASSCVAVGSDGHGQPLELAGDPSSWSVAQAHEVKLDGTFGASGSLLSVTCMSASSCVAVGGDGRGQPLMVGGDPSTPWTAAQAQDTVLGDSFSSGGQLLSISCASSSNCVATGSDANDQPLVLAGDPSAWGAAQAQEMTLNGEAFGAETYPDTLTCTSKTSCLELGEYFTGYDESPYLIQGHPATWDQASAVLMTGLSPDSFLGGNACPSPTYCVAVGGDGISYEPLVLTGDPSTWGTAEGRVIALGDAFGDGGSLYSVACSSTTSCVAVGRDFNGRPLVVAGDPATWTSANAREIALPKKLHTYGALYSIACTSTTSCVAVGYDGYGYLRQPLVLSGDPASWNAKNAKQITMSGDLGNGGSFYSISCISSTYCVSVGLSGSSAIRPLVLAGNPATWTSQRAFNLSATAATSTTAAGLGFGGRGSGYLISISCEHKRYCVVVGGDRNSAPLYLVGNPGTWKGQSLARPEKQSPSFLRAELTTSSCTATACFAGGVANGGDFVASFGP